jgi:hypothetical protein
MSLPDVFQWVSLSNKTGELVLQCENEEAYIVFYQGNIMYAFVNTGEYLLGQLLLNYGKINRSQLIKALGIQKKEKKSLGQILLDLSVLKKEDLNEIISIQIHQVIYHLLEWETGFFRFEEKDVAQNTNILLKPDSIIMEGMRRLDEKKNILNYLKYESIVSLVSGDTEGKIFSKIDGKKSVSEIINTVGGDSYLVLETLYRALREGKIKITGEKEITSGNPIVKFLVALELFNRGKIYESFQHVSSIISSGYQNDQIFKFYENLKLFVTRYFVKKYGGNTSCFDLNRLRLLDEKIYITPVEGYILSRIEESPCINMLEKVVNVSLEELYLIIDKLYELGLLLLKTKENNKSEVMGLHIVNTLIDIFKRELSGELELITKKANLRIFFVNGRIKFLYSYTDKYSIKKYLSENNNIYIEKEEDNNIETFLEDIMSHNNLGVSELSPVLEIYQNMIFYEIIVQEPISIIFTYDREFNINFNIEMNLLHMIVFSIVNNNVNIENELNLSSAYELLPSKERVLDNFSNVAGLEHILEKFEEKVINPTVLRQLNEKELKIINILNKLGFIKECEDSDSSIAELEEYLEKIKDLTPLELFGYTEDKTLDIEDIKHKYLKLSKKYHPDLYPDDKLKKLAKDIFEKIKFSYDIIMAEGAVNTQNDSLKIDAKKIFLAEQLFTSGKVYLNMGRLPDAIDAFIKAYQNFSEDDELKAYYGLSLIRSGKCPDGFKIMQEANFQQFNDFNLYLAYIDCAMKLKNNTEANKIIKKAMVKFPDNVNRLIALQNKLK